MNKIIGCFALALLTACGTPSMSTDSATDTGTSPNDSGTNPTDTGSSANDSGTEPTDAGPTECSRLPRQECAQCCDSENPRATQLVQVYSVNACGCAANAPCMTDCGSNLCMGMQPTQACSTCINNQLQALGACVQSGIQMCAADSECAPVLQCASTCR